MDRCQKIDCRADGEAILRATRLLQIKGPENLSTRSSAKHNGSRSPISTKNGIDSDVQSVISKASEISRIHYGCGSHFLKGWLNVDFNSSDREGYLSATVNLVKRHPFPEDHFEFGFAEDFIEHLGQADQIIFLYEVYRTFKKGGVLRLSFPKLEGVLRKHYTKTEYETAALAKYNAYEKRGHLHFLSVNELELICKHIGFRELNMVEYGDSVYGELKGLDTRKNQIGLNTYVEIIK